MDAGFGLRVTITGLGLEAYLLPYVGYNGRYGGRTCMDYECLVLRKCCGRLVVSLGSTGHA